VVKIVSEVHPNHSSANHCEFPGLIGLPNATYHHIQCWWL